MSKKEKLLGRLCKIPPPVDFKWDDLITLMTHHGFSNECDGGSHYIFEHECGLRLTVSKTHPSGLLKAYQIRDVKDALRRVQAIPEDNHD